MDPNDVRLNDTKGFNVLSGVSIFPHYTNKKSKLTKEKSEVIAVPKEDAIYVNENKVEVIGTKPYYTFKDGISKNWNKRYMINTTTSNKVIRKRLHIY